MFSIVLYHDIKRHNYHILRASKPLNIIRAITLLSTIIGKIIRAIILQIDCQDSDTSDSSECDSVARNNCVFPARMLS